MADKRKEHPVCKYCGSDQVTADAAVRYDKEQNDWIISSIFDGGNCDTCGEENRHNFDWKDTP